MNSLFVSSYVATECFGSVLSRTNRSLTTGAGDRFVSRSAQSETVTKRTAPLLLAVWKPNST
ncbi:MAG: hypothetical protein A2X67_10585 [Ignavibacteria bacterium GWA2_55_11]|nr:MAG: hypothetical protein A2X67_10585 [Ignavibacteria bacterium GWA2_55_11]OGU71726.1 MAG: hypothetical protein A3H45_04395 [Ignavibacteria bacterium RIFCSPLOWO2_02_FULL_55_14]